MREEKRLTAENAKLKNDIEELKKQLLDREKRRGGMSTRTDEDNMSAGLTWVDLFQEGFAGMKSVWKK